MKTISAAVLILIAFVAGFLAWRHPGVGDLKWLFISLQSALFAIFVNTYGAPKP